MKYYKIIRYCKSCQKKFFASGERGFSQYYCEDCFKKFKK